MMVIIWCYVLSGTALLLQGFGIRERAIIRACGIQGCNKCNNTNGWHLQGHDWGCCGNYEGCCRMASTLCYVHDRFCQCCRFGVLICGPECQPDISCRISDKNAIKDEHPPRNKHSQVRKTMSTDHPVSHPPDAHAHVNPDISNDSSLVWNKNREKLIKASRGMFKTDSEEGSGEVEEDKL